MSPAAGGPAPAPAPAQSAAAVPQAIAVPPESGRSAPEASRRDPPAHPEGADPTNAAARKTTWSVLAQTPAAAAEATPEGGGIIGGDASWPALVESTRACPKSGSSDSLNALSDVSGPPPQEDTIAASSVLPHPVVGANPIPTAQNPTSIPPRTPAASSQQNGATTQTFPVRRSGNRGNGSNGGVRAANSSGGDGSSGSGGDADVQPYPVYLPPVEQFQNMHLLRPPMQPAWVPPHQDQPNLQDSIRNQIEFYFR
ncbi:hypothetical protein Zm00014a_023893 [Zea mays]|uniref:Uncharacterized protein n=1 Tax=Zea mays TaxID=4577 RepID=A0A3L6E2T1_MAIZE|nr:hypothetical protein Zm00014a_023893 [Zea mays]